MDEKLSIKIKIADREYPMRVKPEEEELLRIAGKLINEKLKFYKQKFKIDDRQDLLAMVVFDSVVEKERMENQNSISEELLSSKLDDLNRLLSENM